MVKERKRSTSLHEYASPLMNRTSLSEVQENAQLNHPRFSILFNMTKTKALSNVAERIVARAHAAGHDPLRYSLAILFNEKGEKRYQLRSNQDNALVTPQGKYSYVILADDAGSYELRIGNMHHYYLADKSLEVYAAGEIQFSACEEGADYADILFINPHSGGYHTDEIEQLIRSMKDLSIVNILEAVGLPADKFQPVNVQSATAESPKRRFSI